MPIRVEDGVGALLLSLGLSALAATLGWPGWRLVPPPARRWLPLAGVAVVIAAIGLALLEANQDARSQHIN